MIEERWKPHATVAALAERDGQYLLVKERVAGSIRFNQPAGHLEPGESIVEAVVRETLEETGYQFRPTGLQSIYRLMPDSDSDKTYLRFLFRGEIGDRSHSELDQGIISAEWMDYNQIVACRDKHRSPLVLQSIDDYLAGPGYPLNIFSDLFG
jgi:8-oxo-dGTP pyrophosphatase MutT (NUDIX family)